MQPKLLAAGLTLCLTAGLGLFGEHLKAQESEQAVRDQLHWNSLGAGLPRDPAGVLSAMYRLLAEPGYSSGNRVHQACYLFEDSARPAFAAAYGEPDCNTAMRKLAEKVTNKQTYDDFDYSYSGDRWIRGEDGYMDGCAIVWNNGPFDAKGQPDPGPRLGKMWMRRVAGQGFWVTRFERCPAEASRTHTPAPSTAPTTAPRLLPSYAPTYPGVLVGRIAKRDAEVCEFFTPQGRAEFAAAAGVADCPAAVAKLAGQVTDAQRYGNPLATGTPEKIGPGGKVLVDGCSMEWPPGGPVPGPKVGRLTLEKPPGGDIGYLIAGYKPC